MKYKDIITYELAEEVTEEHLLKVAERVKNEWMKKQPGFISWEIHRNSNGEYVDIVYWESRETAKNAEKEMGNIPNGEEWMSCYQAGTIKSNNLHLAGSFPAKED